METQTKTPETASEAFFEKHEKAPAYLIYTNENDKKTITLNYIEEWKHLITGVLAGGLEVSTTCEKNGNFIDAESIAYNKRGKWRLPEFLTETTRLGVEINAFNETILFLQSKGVKADLWDEHLHLCRSKCGFLGSVAFIVIGSDVWYKKTEYGSIRFVRELV